MGEASAQSAYAPSRPAAPAAPAPAPAERLFRVHTAAEHRPPFSFSLGLAAAGLPELIVFGLRDTIAQSLLNQVARDLVAGKSLTPGVSYEDYLVGYPVNFREITSNNEYAEFVMIGTAFARVPMPKLGSFRALQVVWSDHSRRFPNDPGYDGERQPLL